MDDFIDSAKSLVPSNYLDRSRDACKQLQKKINEMLYHRKLPQKGFSEHTIEQIFFLLSRMDSNNYIDNCGVGEREGRIFSSLVFRRSFGLIHGIGRSGDIGEAQPKAAGSSLLNTLTNALALHALQIAGFHNLYDAVVIPVATGMSLTLCMLALRKLRPKSRYVIWPRIDQKSCIKSVLTAGFELLVVENVLEGDELRTNLPEIERLITLHGKDQILCIMSTTSCFAPRVCDKVVQISTLCLNYNIPHLINNAYGVQSSKIVHLIEEAHRIGRVDFIVQSTDKNFLVPVGGSLIATYTKDNLDLLRKTYPGRASACPTVDLFATLLSLGSDGYRTKLHERSHMYEYLREKLTEVASSFNERVLTTPNNPISLAMTLSNFKKRNDVTQIGSQLFSKHVSGCRVVPQNGKVTTIEGHAFKNFWSHASDYPYPYMNAAAAIGMVKTDVDLFIKRLNKVLKKYVSSSSSSSSNNESNDNQKQQEQQML